MIFLDTSILSDLVEPASPWHGWSLNGLIGSGSFDLMTNAVAAAEFSTHFDSATGLEKWLRATRIRVAPLDIATSFRAGVAFKLYRRRGGPRTAFLADFLIGAHALVLGATLLTRDAGRFSGYFPDLAMITPETHP